jgi:UDP-glucose 4-epimerase
MILVTGSAGHLGEGLMRRLRAAGRPTRGLDIKPSDFTDRVGSITDRGFVRDCVAGATHIIHAATLHKPHVATHAQQDFVDVNITGTLALLEAAVAARVEAFVFTSTTSTFGAALTPAEGEPTAWVTESVTPIPKNIYGVTKLAAEGLCELHRRRDGLPVLVLRTSRFFPEEDDDPATRRRYSIENAQANELLYRRVDLEDVVEAHLLALERAPSLGFGRYIISATTPFRPADMAALRRDAAAAVEKLYPEVRALYAARGWSLYPALDRVYANDLARAELGWRPRHDFACVLDALHEGREFRSALAREVGSKGYHATAFETGPYPVV